MERVLSWAGIRVLLFAELCKRGLKNVPLWVLNAKEKFCNAVSNFMPSFKRNNRQYSFRVDVRSRL